MSTIGAITYEDAVDYTASDSVNDPAGPFAGFYTGAGGTIKVTTIRGTTRQITGLQAGVFVTLAILRVWANPAPPSGSFALTAPPYAGKRPPGP